MCRQTDKKKTEWKNWQLLVANAPRGEDSLTARNVTY